MYIAVVFYDESFNCFKTKPYTYTTNLPLEAGMVVSAPVKNRKTGTVENKKALIVGVNMPEPPFECAQITSLWTEEV